MAEEEMSNGEIRRTLRRLDETLAEKASKEALAEFKGEVREKFKRAEALSVERRDKLEKADDELGERIDDTNERMDGIEKTRTSRAANWIALGLLGLTAIGLVVTVLSLSHGGK